MASVAFIDFETRSTVDLKKSGSDVYARHPSTQIMCLGWALDDGPITVWRRGDDSPVALMDHVRDGHPVVGHNVGGFEFPIWNHAGKKLGWPDLKPEQVVCTMAMAAAMALPMSLEKAAAAVGIEAQKDLKGSRVMLALCKPKGFSAYGVPTYIEDADKLETLYEYCKQDVEVERQLYRRLMPLSPLERQVWLLDLKVNQRGIRVDIPRATAALKIVDLEKARFNVRIQKLTKQFVTTYNETGRFREWIETRGVGEVPSIAKADVIELLSREDLPSDVREALMLRQEAAKSSTAKLESMISSTCSDGRIRGIFQYHGAGTGRWAGRRLQAQNLPRSTMKQARLDEVFELLGALT